jgi:hypothetical protein
VLSVWSLYREEDAVPLSQDEIAILRKHKEWANGYSVIWLIIAFGVLGGNYWLLTMAATSDMDRICMMVVVATLLLIIAIWQAAGMSLARIERMVRNPAT